MSNIFDSLKASDEHAGDIKRLREAIPILQTFRFSDSEIERLYDSFSDSYCAGWLVVDARTIEDFTNWLEN